MAFLGSLGFPQDDDPPLSCMKAHSDTLDMFLSIAAPLPALFGAAHGAGRDIPQLPHSEQLGENSTRPFLCCHTINNSSHCSM